MSDQLMSRAGTFTSGEDRFINRKTTKDINTFKIPVGYHQYFTVLKAPESAKRSSVTDISGF